MKVKIKQYRRKLSAGLQAMRVPDVDQNAPAKGALQYGVTGAQLGMQVGGPLGAAIGAGAGAIGGYALGEYNKERQERSRAAYKPQKDYADAQNQILASDTIKRQDATNLLGGINSSSDAYSPDAVRNPMGRNGIRRMGERKLSKGQRPNVEVEGGEMIGSTRGGKVSVRGIVKGPSHERGGVDAKLEDGDFVISNHDGASRKAAQAAARGDMSTVNKIRKQMPLKEGEQLELRRGTSSFRAPLFGCGLPKMDDGNPGDDEKEKKRMEETAKRNKDMADKISRGELTGTKGTYTGGQPSVSGTTPKGSRVTMWEVPGASLAQSAATNLTKDSDAWKKEVDRIDNLSDEDFKKEMERRRKIDPTGKNIEKKWKDRFDKLNPSQEFYEESEVTKTEPKEEPKTEPKVEPKVETKPKAGSRLGGAVRTEEPAPAPEKTPYEPDVILPPKPFENLATWGNVGLNLLRSQDPLRYDPDRIRQEKKTFVARVGSDEGKNVANRAMGIRSGGNALAGAAAAANRGVAQDRQEMEIARQNQALAHNISGQNVDIDNRVAQQNLGLKQQADQQLRRDSAARDAYANAAMKETVDKAYHTEGNVNRYNQANYEAAALKAKNLNDAAAASDYQDKQMQMIKEMYKEPVMNPNWGNLGLSPTVTGTSSNPTTGPTLPSAPGVPTQTTDQTTNQTTAVDENGNPIAKKGINFFKRKKING